MILAYLCGSVGSAGIPYKGGFGNTCTNFFAHCIHHNLVSEDDERHRQGIIPDMMIDGRYPAGQPPNALDNSLRLVELKTLAQRGVSVEERARRIQRDVEHHAKELDAMDDRNTVYPELMSYGPYAALVVGRFGEFSKDFVTLRDYVARHKAYAYVEHFNSSINFAMSMFKLSITTRWALMAARGWARLILDRRRDLINDRPSRAAAAECPLEGAQERHHFENPTSHLRGTFRHGSAE